MINGARCERCLFSRIGRSPGPKSTDAEESACSGCATAGRPVRVVRTSPEVCREVFQPLCEAGQSIENRGIGGGRNILEIGPVQPTQRAQQYAALVERATEIEFRVGEVSDA